MAEAEKTVAPDPLPVMVVADFFLDQAADAGEFLSPMKLQKLVYIAHGWHLAATGGALIRESVGAWKFGPVVRSLYHAFKECGGGPIDEQRAIDTLHGASRRDYREAQDRLASGDRYDVTRQVLGKVWNRYRRYTALELSAMTHETGAPWDAAIKRPSFAGDHPISNEEIRQYYLRLIKESRLG